MIDIKNVAVWFYMKDGKLNIEMRCPDCGSKVEIGKKGAQDKDQLVYVVNCPRCNKTLIEYSSPQELPEELSKIVANWRV